MIYSSAAPPRHGRARPGHPHLHRTCENSSCARHRARGDGRDKPGHDGLGDPCRTSIIRAVGISSYIDLSENRQVIQQGGGFARYGLLRSQPEFSHSTTVWSIAEQIPLVVTISRHMTATLTLSVHRHEPRDGRSITAMTNSSSAPSSRMQRAKLWFVSRTVTTLLIHSTQHT